MDTTATRPPTACSDTVAVVVLACPHDPDGSDDAHTLDLASDTCSCGTAAGTVAVHSVRHDTARGLHLCRGCLPPVDQLIAVTVDRRKRRRFTTHRRRLHVTAAHCRLCDHVEVDVERVREHVLEQHPGRYRVERT